MSSTHLADLGLGAFEQVVASTSGFRPRAGQRAMAACVAQTLSACDLGEKPDPTQAIAVIQAGTGVGKSAAYASTAIALALERKTRVLISTATVALQEQLIHKDLPALARSMDQEFVFALAKGRGRYVCKLKLERLVTLEPGTDALFDDEVAPPTASRYSSVLSKEALEERRSSLLETMATRLAKSQWDGDRDTLPEPPDASDWAIVAADRHTCTIRHCPRFRDCSYYQARIRLSEANVIVANHDLVLASLGTKNLPELHDCLLVFDEGHHLPAVALSQFSSSLDLSGLRWLDKLPKVLADVSKHLQLALSQDTSTLASQLKVALTQLARQVIDLVQASTDGKDGRLRFLHGQLPANLHEPVTLIQGHARGLTEAVAALGDEVKRLAKEEPAQALQCAQLYAQLGALAPKLDAALSTSALLLEHGPQPLAKWLQVEANNGFINASAHASPIVPGDLLRQFLWSRVRGAIVTSASLTSCGSFDYFLGEAGLDGNANVSTLEVNSPFDYARQGSLTVVQTRADPKNAEAYTAEMVQTLIADIEKVRRGALVLFTSRAQMRAAVDALPGHLQDMVLVQGNQSRTRILQAHAERIQSGLPSVLFGMQSFGEGLDLPGELCETVCIAKLPFAPPSEPVDEARAEWLRSVGRDPFNELVIPATGVKLLQWTGRAIRTEDDQAQVICYDKRLTQQAYGRRMLAGLPPYRLEHRMPAS